MCENKKGITLTMGEILDLAEFAGFKLEPPNENDDMGITITISPCNPDGVKEDGGSVGKYKFVAFFEEYPEEGVYPLGHRLN